MKISVVIPTFNRARLLARTIPALVHQRRGDFRYEVIFVSNGSSDNTGEVLQEAGSRFPETIRHFTIAPTGGPSAPRNAGIRAASGDVVIILDDDVLPDADLVLRHAEFHQVHPALHEAAIGEVYIAPHLIHDPMSLFHTFPYEEVRGLDRLSYLHFWTCNVSFKREFMLHSGMFDERFLYFEDVVCSYRLARNGMHLRFLPAARGQHLHQLLPSGVASKAFFTGLWLHAFLEEVPDRTAKARFGVLSMDLPAGQLIRRALARLLFRLVDNPATLRMLLLLGASGPTRTRVTDCYYGLIFRHNLLAGYHRAETGKGPAITAAEWVNRGEP